ncbi:Vesicle transport protein USE1 [Amphibalanus amphitrite]|uniref:Vesicle transport protein USE1 n=1 Tax=Amphibalanus amphitrite TaxID=1232801 RepID=A0A6A4VYU8_AMPAM|nr:Vesicle transport protein USE1 [Amphibalanus amphitrite]KAF0296755.1 Vesicle transport protein USE1 [Amphibalanus amphitrite]KAF0296756.1 Vesicle transport protein USE1 [Amphibalanus amphitrite]KAF0296757.1 Vesicle transport protein USE1 [Amphibalanus amphitrite]
MASRMEVNLSRLLQQCERMAAAEECDGNWRYEQYVKALRTQFDALKSSPSAPSPEKLSEFGRRIEHLQSFLPPEPQVTPPSAEPPARPAASPPVSPVLTVVSRSHASPALTELRHRRGGRAHAEARAQLLGTPVGGDAAPAASGGGSVEEDFEQVMKRHHELQERAAEEMLALTRNLKEQSLIAKNVIAKDRETLERSTALTDKNTGRLERESQRLAEFSRRACRCWLWIMLAVVCATFMGMVVFIRLFGKKVLTATPAE